MMQAIFISLHVIQVAVILRVMLRRHRVAASRVAWVAVITVVPYLGVLIYLLFGEVSIGRRRVARMRKIIEQMPKLSIVRQADDQPTAPDGSPAAAQVPELYASLFRLGRSINGYDVIGGNSGDLMADSNAAIDSMVADIDAATSHVHLLFYIWLPDNNGRKMIEALKRAASRGVTCRAMADDLGSRTLIRSEHWQQMQDAGVQVARALQIGNPLLRPFHGRIDLRNHRKILEIDGAITYCGSQNCADPEFLVKAKYAPWVDAVIRFGGPIARQNQHLFASDWMEYFDEDISDLLRRPVEMRQEGFPAQVIGTGPTVRNSAMPEMFESLFHAARSELVISTPYFVPDESMKTALCTAAYRGVKTMIIFPARNDSWIVGAASRSHYADLLDAGVQVYEYVGGLLHTKSVTLDGQITLIGSANMDRRSFDLNYENNILLHDSDLTGQVRSRQQEYIAKSNRITREMVAAWPPRRRLWNNTLAVLGPIL